MSIANEQKRQAQLATHRARVRRRLGYQLGSSERGEAGGLIVFRDPDPLTAREAREARAARLRCVQDERRREHRSTTSNSPQRRGFQ
jgi:hypothetical protein